MIRVVPMAIVAIAVLCTAGCYSAEGKSPDVDDTSSQLESDSIGSDTSTSIDGTADGTASGDDSSIGESSVPETNTGDTDSGNTDTAVSEQTSDDDGVSEDYVIFDAEGAHAVLNQAVVEPFGCQFEIDWAAVPDEYPDESGVIVFKSCSQTRVFLIPADSGEKLELTYLESCSDEDPASDNAHMRMGWTWTELEGTSWADIAAIERGEIERCDLVRLCENACNQAKDENGAQTWEGVSASFYFRSISIIE